MRRKIICLIGAIIMFGSIFFGCRNKKNNSEVYKYEKEKQWSTTQFYKSEYFGDKMVLSYKSDIDFENYSVEIDCFDSDFNCIMKNVTNKIEDGQITLITDRAKEISGIKIRLDSKETFALRYLKTEEYSMLEYVFAYDIGAVEIGDTDTYYTKEEQEKFQKNREESVRKSDEAFAMLEGKWLSEDKSRKLEFVNEGKYKIKKLTIDDESQKWDEEIIYTESAVISEENEETNIRLSTGNMTAPLDCKLTEKDSRLEFMGEVYVRDEKRSKYLLPPTSFVVSKNSGISGQDARYT